MANIITSPVTVTNPATLNASGATFTPGAAYVIAANADIINAAWNLGLDQKTDFDTKVAALAAAVAAIISGSTFDITASSAAEAAIVEPTVTIPTTIDTSTIMADFNAESTVLIAELVSKVQYVLTTWFPNDTAHFASASTWMNNALADNSGLPMAVRDQITSDDLARVAADSTRAQDAVIQAFAARRFPLPGGQAASAVIQIQQKAQEGMAESSRKITISSIERLQWAAKELVGLRQLAMNEALDYAKTMSAAQNTSAAVTGIGIDAQSKLIAAVSSWYNARIDAAKTLNQAKQFNADQTQEVAIKNQASDLELLRQQVDVLRAELAAIAQMATSLFNNVHASAGSSYGVSA